MCSSNWPLNFLCNATLRSFRRQQSQLHGEARPSRLPVSHPAAVQRAVDVLWEARQRRLPRAGDARATMAGRNDDQQRIHRQECHRPQHSATGFRKLKWRTFIFFCMVRPRPSQCLSCTERQSRPLFVLPLSVLSASQNKKERLVAIETHCGQQTGMLLARVFEKACLFLFSLISSCLLLRFRSLVSSTVHTLACASWSDTFLHTGGWREKDT